MGGASALRKGSSGRDLYGIVPISLFQNEVGGGVAGASLHSSIPTLRILAGGGGAVTLHIPTWWHLVHGTHHTCIQPRAHKLPPAHSIEPLYIYHLILTIVLHSFLSISSELCHPFPE